MNKWSDYYFVFEIYLQTADDAIKQKFQEEADQVNAANMLLPKPKRQPKKEKTPNATKKRVQDRAAKANENPSVDQSKVLKKEKFKRPVSAFVHFSSEFRSVAKGNHPELGFGQISRVLAEMWRDADEDTKLKFKRLSLEQSERYRKVISSTIWKY